MQQSVRWGLRKRRVTEGDREGQTGKRKRQEGAGRMSFFLRLRLDEIRLDDSWVSPYFEEEITAHLFTGILYSDRSHVGQLTSFRMVSQHYLCLGLEYYLRQEYPRAVVNNFNNNHLSDIWQWIAWSFSPKPSTFWLLFGQQFLRTHWKLKVALERPQRGLNGWSDFGKIQIGASHQ